MQKSLVTGAEGFTGTYLVRLLKEQGYQVTAGVWNRARKLAFERENVKSLVCDVSDAISVARTIASAKPDRIVHLAGPSRSNNAFEEPLLTYQSTVSAWANVLDGARRAVPRARILMISSAEVYGASAATGRPVGENTACNPDTTFGSLKFAAESLAATYHRDYHLDVMIARPFQYVGAGQSAGCFWQSCARLFMPTGGASHSETFVLPQSSAGFDMLHVADVAAAYMCLLENGRPNESYNVCCGQMTNFGAIWQQFGTLSGRTQPQPAGSNEFGATIANLCGDNSKLKACGWSPKYTWQQGLQSLWEGLRQAAGQPTAATASTATP